MLAGLLLWPAVRQQDLRRPAGRLAVIGPAAAVLGLAAAGFDSRSGSTLYVVASKVARPTPAGLLHHLRQARGS